MVQLNRETIQHYHEPGDLHEVTFSCFRPPGKRLVTMAVGMRIGKSASSGSPQHGRVARATQPQRVFYEDADDAAFLKRFDVARQIDFVAGKAARLSSLRGLAPR